MPNYLLEYQIRIRNRADSSDLVVITSVRGGTNPYLAGPPKGDGASFNPLTNESLCASYSARVIDVVTSGSDRVVTSKLEDVNQRLQLGYLKAFVESRRDGGSWGVLCAGYLTLLRLTEALTWDLQIQDATRVHGGVELFNALDDTTIANFLIDWPNRGCLFGGPIMGTFREMPDYGGWEMRVTVSSALGGSLGTIYQLQPVAAYGVFGMKPVEGWAETAAAVNDAVRSQSINPRVNLNTKAFTTVGDTYKHAGTWPGLILLINGVAWRAIGAANLRLGGGGNVSTVIGTDKLLLSRAAGDPFDGMLAYRDTQSALTVGTTYRVRCLTILPSEVSPIYMDLHPVDWLELAMQLANLEYDTSAFFALKSLLGLGLRLSRRITSSEQMGQFIRSCVFNFGIALRLDSLGRIVPFSTRVFPNTPPTKTITDAHLVDGASRLNFEQDASQGLQRVTFRQKIQNFITGTATGIEETENEITLLNEDSDALRSGTVEINIPGTVRSDPASKDPVGPDWLVGVAHQLFDRYGRGNQALERELIRGDGTSDADTLVLGEEVLVDISELPNHNKRLGDDVAVSARAMQVTRIDEEPASRVVRFEDSGPNAQPLATKPTHTIAKSTDMPRNVAELTITNAAALNALGYAVRIQIAVTTGAAPAAADYVDVWTTPQAEIPTTAIRLPSVTAGRTVYARARSEVINASRPSDWQTAVSVALDAINPVSALAAAAVTGDGSLLDLTWTAGSGTSDCLVDVYRRPSGASFTDAVRVVQMPPGGATRYRVEGLTANTAYTVSVQYVDPKTGDKSALVEDTETTHNGARALAAPTNPVGFSGMRTVS